MNNLGVMTPEDVAQELQVPIEAVMAEIESGRLKAFRFGGSWRLTVEAVRRMIDELSGGNDPETSNTTTDTDDQQALVDEKGLPTVKQLKNMKWTKIEDGFQKVWPAKKGEEKPVEIYQEAYEWQIMVNGKLLTFVVGFCDRAAAGKADRRRAVIFWGGVNGSLYPVTEFVGANNFDVSGIMASIIRTKDRKHVGQNATLPTGYDDVPTGVYNEIVDGPYASSGQCVVARSTDFAVMARHALLSSQQREWV